MIADIAATLILDITTVLKILAAIDAPSGALAEFIAPAMTAAARGSGALVRSSTSDERCSQCALCDRNAAAIQHLTQFGERTIHPFPSGLLARLERRAYVFK